jgi:hypothetical protein
MRAGEVVAMIERAQAQHCQGQHQKRYGDGAEQADAGAKAE